MVQAIGTSVNGNAVKPIMNSKFQTQGPNARRKKKEMQNN